MRPRSDHAVTCWTLTTQFALCWCWVREFDYRYAYLIDYAHAIMLVMDTELWPRSCYWTLTTKFKFCGVEYGHLTTVLIDHSSYVGAGYGTMTTQFSFCWGGLINLYLKLVICSLTPVQWRLHTRIQATQTYLRVTFPPWCVRHKKCLETMFCMETNWLDTWLCGQVMLIVRVNW